MKKRVMSQPRLYLTVDPYSQIISLVCSNVVGIADLYNGMSIRCDYKIILGLISLEFKVLS
jgi:hypothetical protein